MDLIEKIVAYLTLLPFIIMGIWVIIIVIKIIWRGFKDLFDSI